MTRRVGIISLIHESNTFADTPTTIASFRRDGLLFGEEVRQEFAGSLHQGSGFLEGLAAAGIEAVPVFHASTTPSGTITRETCDELMRLMFSALDEAGPLDGFLVSPHGANAGEGRGVPRSRRPLADPPARPRRRRMPHHLRHRSARQPLPTHGRGVRRHYCIPLQPPPRPEGARPRGRLADGAHPRR